MAIHVFHLLYLFVWEILCLVLFVRYCACIEHNILILYDMILNLFSRDSD